MLSVLCCVFTCYFTGCFEDLKFFSVSEAWSPIQCYHTSLYCLFARTVTQFPSKTFFPIRKLPLASYPSLSEGRQTENHNHRKLTIWSHGPQPYLPQWNYEPCHVGSPKMDRSWWRGLTECGPLEKGMANHFSILTLRTPWTVWKGKKIGHWKMNSPGW